MISSLVNSVDVVGCAIAARVHELGGDDEMVREIALAACYALWFTACPAPPSRSPVA